MSDTDLTAENITQIAKALGAGEYSRFTTTYAAKAAEIILRARQIEAEAKVNQQFLDTIAALVPQQTVNVVSGENS